MSDSIQTRLEQAQANLAAALSSGEDTAPIRAEIADLERQLSAERKEQAAQSDKQRREEAEALEQASAGTAEKALQAISEAAHVEGLAEMLPTGIAPSEASEDPDLRHAAAMVAKAQAGLEKASEQHRAAQDEVDALSERLSAKETRQYELKQARLNGDKSAEGAAELHAIGLDIEGLMELRHSACVRANNLLPTAEQKALDEAQQHLNRIQAKAVVKLLEARTKQAEAVFLEAHRQLVDAAMAARLATSRFNAYRPSNDLKIVCYGTSSF